MQSICINCPAINKTKTHKKQTPVQMTNLAHYESTRIFPHFDPLEIIPIHFIWLHISNKFSLLLLHFHSVFLSSSNLISFEYEFQSVRRITYYVFAHNEYSNLFFTSHFYISTSTQIAESSCMRSDIRCRVLCVCVCAVHSCKVDKMKKKEEGTHQRV